MSPGKGIILFTRWLVVPSWPQEQIRGGNIRQASRIFRLSRGKSSKTEQGRRMQGLAPLPDSAVPALGLQVAPTAGYTAVSHRHSARKPLCVANNRQKQHNKRTIVYTSSNEKELPCKYCSSGFNIICTRSRRSRQSMGSNIFLKPTSLYMYFTGVYVSLHQVFLPFCAIKHNLK